MQAFVTANCFFGANDNFNFGMIYKIVPHPTFVWQFMNHTSNFVTRDYSASVNYGIMVDFVIGHECAGGGVCTVGVTVVVEVGGALLGCASHAPCSIALWSWARCKPMRASPLPPSWRAIDCFDFTFASCAYFLENGLASAQLV